MADGLTREGFQKLAASLGFTMTPEDEEDYFKLTKMMEDEVNEVDALPEYIDPRLEPASSIPVSARTYYVPEKKDNPLNAWSHRFELKDPKAVGGLLAGRSVAVKDTVSVAGIPLTLGTQPYHLSTDTPFPVPTIDAPVVRRIVEAGGVIRGTSTCENYYMSGLSFTSATGPVENPWLPGHSAGGSSSGSAALLALNRVKAWRQRRGLPVGNLGEGVDFAIGGDQGGSIRLPSAYCGIYGLKSTKGLVPYTGIGALHPIADHAGPMATSVADVAILLSAIAGYDGIDPRCTPTTPLREAVPAYHERLSQAIAEKKAAGTWTPTAAGIGLRVGLLQEALVRPEVDHHVIEVVRAAAAQFVRLGATVVDVSAPLHLRAPAIWTAAMRADAADVFLANKAPDLPSYPMPYLQPPPLTQAWFDTMTATSPTVVSAALGAAYLQDAARFPPRFRNKALTHVAQLQAGYDALLANVDVLLLPVTPSVGPPHGDMAGKRVLGKYQAALGVSGNTSCFNLTGHPALAMPGGWGPAINSPGKLPVGIQLAGRHHDEVGVLLAASIWEVGGKGLDGE